ncbi:MAG: BlaI/MecI/CopY family transcriptional regulator, partial [Chloroflexi bacterium]|nr:BlaI/MecI/CopY family transcriptional regulator [Chloroflexota bacterium]
PDKSDLATEVSNSSRVRATQFRPMESGAKRALGDLEAGIMELMWKCDRASVRAIHDRLSDRALAYTTIMTVMSRLATKGLLKKEKEGKQYIYSAALTREEFETSVAKSLLSGLTGNLGTSTLASFVDNIEGDRALQELEELIREKRKLS